MQDCYTGDIGDFAKFGLLRKVTKGMRLGVAWYLHPDPEHPKNNDGKHTKYLCDPDQWRSLDPELFDRLRPLVFEERRSVAEIESSGLLASNTLFANERLNIEKSANAEARQWRADWFKRTKKKLSGCEVVFADPDNGLYGLECVSEAQFGNRQIDSKRLPIKEALELAAGRPAILYHHNTRRRGGHRKEIEDWMKKLDKCSHAFRWRRYSPRTFFFLNATDSMVARLEDFADKWKCCRGHVCNELIPRPTTEV